MRGLLVAAMLILAACSSGPAPSATIGKYQQTWTKAYADTTCTDWNGAMDDHQRFVMAADMLYATRKKQGADALPPDDMVSGFESGIQSVCDAAFGQAGGAVADAATVVYLGGTQYHP